MLYFLFLFLAAVGLTFHIVFFYIFGLWLYILCRPLFRGIIFGFLRFFAVFASAWRNLIWIGVGVRALSTIPYVYLVYRMVFAFTLCFCDGSLKYSLSMYVGT
jgi:hypothetical protein